MTLLKIHTFNLGELLRHVYGWPQSASDHNQIVHYTLRSHLIKNKTDHDNEPNSTTMDNLRLPTQHNADCLEYQLSLLLHRTCYYSVHTNRTWGEREGGEW